MKLVLAILALTGVTFGSTAEAIGAGCPLPERRTTCCEVKPAAAAERSAPGESEAPSENAPQGDCRDCSACNLAPVPPIVPPSGSAATFSEVQRPHQPTEESLPATAAVLPPVPPPRL